MLITDKFVFVHLPKTGGTFVRTVVRDLLVPSRFMQKVHSARRDWGLALPFFPYKYVDLDQHGSCEKIPDRYRDRTILSCYRNPLDLLVSQYYFGWWKKYPYRFFGDPQSVRGQYGSLDSMSFPEFFRASYDGHIWFRHSAKRSGSFDPKYTGWLTCEFLAFYFNTEDRIKILDSSSAGVYELGLVSELMYNVHFLETSALSSDLCNFMLQMGYDRRKVGYIKDMKKVFSHRKGESKYIKYYTNDMISEVLEKERLLYDLFPEYKSV